MIRDARGDRSRQSIAAEAGVSLGWLAKAETAPADYSPDFATLGKVAKVLGLSLDALAGIRPPKAETSRLKGRRVTVDFSDPELAYRPGYPPKGTRIQVIGRVQDRLPLTHGQHVGLVLRAEVKIAEED